MLQWDSSPLWYQDQLPTRPKQCLTSGPCLGIPVMVILPAANIRVEVLHVIPLVSVNKLVQVGPPVKDYLPALESVVVLLIPVTAITLVKGIVPVTEEAPV